MLSHLSNAPQWDMIIIGGGATGLGAAVDAATRGYKTLLVEQYDFAKGTSSRSTKLVHGGVRYLEQGNIKLVREALRERGYLLQNAPHLTSTQKFIVPVFSWWEKWYYAIGLKIYDVLSGKSYVYSPSPGGRFKLYSIGFDQKDDGGSQSNDVTTGDVVWPELSILR